MKGDFSRLSFDPSKHYRGVLHQQGRVWLDSDWNEDVFERLALLRQELRDVIGPNGVPSADHFQIQPSPDAAALDNFLVSAGRGYVGGNLCQIDSNTRYLTQPDFPDPPRIAIPTDGTTLTALIYLEVWNRLITYLEDDSIREVALGGPDTSARLKNITQVKVAVVPNGVTKCSQASAFIPAPGAGTLTTLQPAINPASTACQLPDSANFTGRENHLYRVQVHDAGDVAGAASTTAFSATLNANAAIGATTLTLSRKLTADETSTAQRAGFVAISDNLGTTERVGLAGVSNAAATTVLTLAQPIANAYTTANGGKVAGGIARFKWSRDNASFAVSVTAVKADRVTVTLASIGRDLASTLRQGDLVELTDDASELGPARGHLTFLKTDPDPDLFTAVLADPLPASFALTGERSLRHLVLRRWDGLGDAAAAFNDAATPGMNLGDGVHIQFGGFDLHPGDYWIFTARAADGSIEALTNAEPHGIRRSTCPLALVTWGPPPATTPPSTPPGGVAMTITDCRRIFPPLVDFPQPEKGFHVNSVLVADPVNAALRTVLPNDTNVQLNAFGGVDIQFDAAPDPDSISRPTVFLSAEFPISAGAYFPINLVGTLSTLGSTVSWRPPAATVSLLNDLINAAQNDPRQAVLMRVTLRGRLIWTQNDPTIFLDGSVFGQQVGASANIALRLPSGDNRRSGDFEMWFWLVATPSFAKDIDIAPPQIFKGETAKVTVTFSAPALSGGDTAVTVTSTNAAVAAAPAAPVPAPTGSTFVTFNVTGLTVGTTTFSAKFNNQTVAATLSVAPLPTLTGSLRITPTTISVGNQATATITLTGPAPAAGSVVTLTSTAPNVARVPGSVTVPAGSAIATFAITGLAVGQASISATLGIALSGFITVVPIPPKNRLLEIEVKPRFSDTVVLRTGGKIADASGSLQSAVRRGGSTDPGTARSFIQPEERPAVEEHILEASRPEDEEPA